MPATLKDIASKAGVSLPVVSAVLNKKSRNSRVSVATRQRIESIARELEYRPNITAQHLRDKETRSINVVIPSFRLFETEHYTQLVIALQEYLAGKGYTLQVTSLDTAFREDRLINNISTDGLILFYWGGKEKMIDELCKLEVPLVMVNGRYDGDKGGNVYVDTRGGMADMAREVLKAGHTRITYVNTYPGDISHQEAFAGLQDVLAGRLEVTLNTVELGPKPGSPVMDEGVRMGCDGLDRALEAPEKPSVVMFNDDVVAMAAVRRVFERGLRVPEDISITGAGDSRLGRVGITRLTTTENRARDLGMRAGEMMLDVLNGSGTAVRQEAVPVKAIIRESLGKI